MSSTLLVYSRLQPFVVCLSVICGTSVVMGYPVFTRYFTMHINAVNVQVYKLRGSSIFMKHIRNLCCSGNTNPSFPD